MNYLIPNGVGNSFVESTLVMVNLLPALECLWLSAVTFAYLSFDMYYYWCDECLYDSMVYLCDVLLILYIMWSTPDVMELNSTALQGVAPSLNIILWVHYSKLCWKIFMICTCVIVVGSFLSWQRIQNAMRDILSFLFFGCFQIGWLPFCFKNGLLSEMDII